MKKLGKLLCVFALVAAMTSAVSAEDKVETYVDDNGCVVTVVNGEVTGIDCEVELPPVQTFDFIYPWG